MFKQVRKSVEDFCNDDDLCVICAFVLAGFLLCLFLNNGTSGFANLEEVFDMETPPPVKNNGTDAKETATAEVQVGRVPKPRTSDKIPADLQRKLALAQQGPRGTGPQIRQQPGLLTQDASIWKPFDEVWNPGFMPIDMVFKGINQIPTRGVPAAASPKGVVNGATAPPAAEAAATDKEAASPEGELKVILVYAPWCGHSKNMLPDYEKVKSEFHGKQINNSKVSIIMYNSDVDKAKVKEYQVKGFPTLFVEKNGKLSPFPHRTYDEISEYINQNA